jgi:hypothetical protein
MVTLRESSPGRVSREQIVGGAVHFGTAEQDVWKSVASPLTELELVGL